MMIDPGIQIEIGSDGHHPLDTLEPSRDQERQDTATTVSDQCDPRSPPFWQEVRERREHRLEHLWTIATMGPEPWTTGRILDESVVTGPAR